MVLPAAAHWGSVKVGMGFFGQIAKDAMTAKQEIVVAGDWSAAWDSTDRGSEQLSPVDQQHCSAL